METKAYSRYVLRPALAVRVGRYQWQPVMNDKLGHVPSEALRPVSRRS
jgi:hypothetical protein